MNRIFPRLLAGLLAFALTLAGAGAMPLPFGRGGAPAGGGGGGGASPALVKIMPLGDSITVGGGGTAGGYRSWQYYDLLAAGYFINHVGSVSGTIFPDDDHEGHSGYVIGVNGTTPTSLRLVIDGVGDPLGTYRPDVIELMIGTNNVAAGDSASAMSGELSDLIDDIKTRLPSAKILVASIITKFGADAAVRNFNTALHDMLTDPLTAKGPNVSFVDMYTQSGITCTGTVAGGVGGGGDCTDLGDGIHPTDATYQNKMEPVWGAAVKAVLGSPPAVGNTLISQWPFDGNLLETYGNNATVFHGAPSFQTGQVGQALQFSTASIDVLRLSEGLNLHGSWTLSGWINYSNITGGGVGIIFYDPNANGVGVFENIGMDGPRLVYRIAGFAHGTAANSLPVGQWKFATVVSNAGTMQMYINGAASGASFSANGFYPRFIGATNGNALPWGGMLDDWRLNNYGMTGPQVLALCQSYATGVC